MNKLGHIRLNLLKQKWLKIVFNFWLMMMIFVFYDKNTLLVVYTHTHTHTFDFCKQLQYF